MWEVSPPDITLARLVEKHDCLVGRFEERRDADQRALQLQAAVYEVKLGGLAKDVANLQRLVYIGLGLILALQFLLMWVKR